MEQENVAEETQAPAPAQAEAPKQQEMTKEHAFKVLDQAISLLQISRKDHILLSHALKVLTH